MVLSIDMKMLAELIKVFFLGVIEGITEWLPVSSTGHMLLFDSLLTLDAEQNFKDVFFVVIQLGAILAVVFCFFSKMNPFGWSAEGKKPTLKKDTVILWCKVAVAVLPSAVIGLFFDDLLEEYFGSPFSIAAMLILYGIVFIVVERYRSDKTPATVACDDISFRLALLIGLFQVLSLIPGTSRSGATVIGAMLIGVARPAAAEFTFFLAVPTMFGASLLKIIKFGGAFSATEGVMLAVGSLTAFAVSLVTVKFLMNFVKKHSFTGFGIYRIILGVAVIVYALL